MQLRSVIIASVLAGALTASAVPARRGPRLYTQPDGTTVEVELVGDEFFHYYRTMDGCPLVKDASGALCYAGVATADGVRSSGIVARNIGERSAAEQQLVSLTDAKSVVRTMANRAKASEKRELANRMRSRMARANVSRGSSLPQSGMGKSTDEFIADGNVKALVVLVEYQDVSFTVSDPYDYFNSMLNERGFSREGGTGCAAEYFEQCSGGAFVPQFDVYGPVKLPQNREYYGKNGDDEYPGDEEGQDLSPHYMVRDAVALLASEVDFSQYDTDKNGYVDNIFIIYAGEGESSSNNKDTVWPHQWNYSYSGEVPPSANGKIIDHYACCNEWVTSRYDSSVSHVDGVGTFIHEFSHVMGLPDLYHVYDSDATWTPGEWSVLDYGPYNNNGRTPPLYSAYERNAMGWLDPMLITDASESFSLRSMDESADACLIQTDRQTDFFLLENRQQTGWDTYLPNHGMLVWHVDATSTPYDRNEVNIDESHQYVEIVEANGLCDAYDWDVMQGYTFPGSSNVTSLSYSSKPASLRPWSNKDLGIEISGISEKDGIISFDVNGGAGALAIPVANEASEVNEATFVANWNAVEGATDYLLSVEALKGGVPVEYTCDFGSGNSLKLPEGWSTSSSDFYKSASNGFYGAAAPALTLGKTKNVSEHFVQSAEYDSDITNVSLWFRGAGAEGGSSFVLSAKVNGSWETIDTVLVDNMDEGEDYDIDLPEGARAIKIVYKKIKGNLALDDIVITCGGERYVAVEGMKDMSTGGATSYKVTWPAGISNARYSVKATDGENVSRSSQYVIVKRNAGVSNVSADRQASISIAGMAATVADGREVVISDLTGRTVARGAGRAEVNAAGVYIISCDGETVKAILK